MKKSISVFTMILCFLVFFSSCKNSDTGKKTETRTSHMSEDTDKATQYKEENLKVVNKQKFLRKNVQCNMNGWSILYAKKDRILMTEGCYLAELKKKDQKFKLNTIVNLTKYGVDNFYMEEGTKFCPSSNGEKLLVFNETVIKDNGEGINFEKNKKLNSILIDLKRKKVRYYRGNDFKDLEKKEDVTEKHLAKAVNTPESLQKVQNKFFRVKNIYTVLFEKNKMITPIRENNTDKFKTLQWALYMYDSKTAKTERVFGFQ